MKLSDIFDLDLFEKHLADGYVRTRKHSTLPLWVAGYTEKAQFDRLWDDVTNNCRGLIYGPDFEVVARPFAKFHNWDESGQPYPPGGECWVMPKMDGSLGILYHAQEEGKEPAWYVATRGSFDSDQSREATVMLWSMFESGAVDHHQLRDDRTYLCEIIYPENRIVVDYGADRKLVLLDVIDNETGRTDLAEFWSLEWPEKVSRTLIRGFYPQLVDEIPNGEEGFVIYWPYRNYRVKMKSADYVALHRIIFGLNARSVWEQLGQGKTVEQICDPLPDEFHDWVKDVAEQLQKRRTVILNETISAGLTAASTIPEHLTKADREFRKLFADQIKKHKYKGYIFAWLDNRDLMSLIWKDLRPEAGWEPRKGAE